MLLGELSLREAKQVPQGLIPGRTRTAGPHGTVLGKGLLNITICPALAGRKPPPGKPPSPHGHLPVCPPEPAHRHEPQLPAATPVLDTSKPPWQWNRGCLPGDKAALTVQNFCKIKCLQQQDRKVVIKNLTSQTIQNIWAPHRSVIRLQHHKRWLCYTHRSS